MAQPVCYDFILHLIVYMALSNCSFFDYVHSKNVVNFGQSLTSTCTSSSGVSVRYGAIAAQM